MSKPRITQHARALALQTIKKQLAGLYREDLLTVQAALAAALSGACAAPVGEPLSATGEWLEERCFLGKQGAPHPYVALHWLDEAGHEHSHLLFAGTLGEYQVAGGSNQAFQRTGARRTSLGRTR